MGTRFKHGRVRAAVAALMLVFCAVAAHPASAVSSVRAPACQGEYQGDARLGPATLPAVWERPVGTLLVGYQRTGGLSPEEFLDRYWDPKANDGQGSWIYPPDDGFLTDGNGHVFRWVDTVEVGVELDRFGSEFGSFLAPAGELYGMRSLPPQSLFTYEAAYPCNYHRYRVVREFRVWEGLTAAWFEQPGLGRQVKLDRALVPGEGRLNVAWLLANDYLVRL